MVYSGLPSPGCAPCRKAKKKCTLERPKCARCIRFRQECTGYRDVSGLRVRDQTELTISRAKTRGPDATTLGDCQNASDTIRNNEASDRESGDQYLRNILGRSEDSSTIAGGTDCGSACGILSATILPESPTLPPDFLRPDPNDIAVNYFMSSFALQNGYWSHVMKYVDSPGNDQCLVPAIKACGMAALSNISSVPLGRDWSRNVYVTALTSLNEALRDPTRCRSDESLIAVSMLSFYENLMCDSTYSISSWKAHITGASQLLKLRGTAQFRSPLGRALFREIRAQILSSCIWDAQASPAFIDELIPVLQAHDVEPKFMDLVDQICSISSEYSRIQSDVRLSLIKDKEALKSLDDIEGRLIDWELTASIAGSRFQFREMVVEDSPHVWNGRLHAFPGPMIPGVWNSYRSLRIMISRAQDFLLARTPGLTTDASLALNRTRVLRRRMADDIPCSIPCQLGHEVPGGYTSNRALPTAYNTIWPLFFAGTCAIERLGGKLWDGQATCADELRTSSSGAFAQLQWVLGRLDYISKSIGLRWADNIAATLRGDASTWDVISTQASLVFHTKTLSAGSQSR